jgi:chlorite dismutase
MADLGFMTTTTSVNHVFFMTVTTTNAWLALTPRERFEFLGEVIEPLLARHSAVSMRFFDSEAFTTDGTDLVMWETPDVLAYQALVEELRETAFWGAYFTIERIVPTIENAYAHHYGVDPL